jgi:predicted nucleotidyltransferase
LEVWLLGYLSGAASTGVWGDPLRPTDANGSFFWLDSFCRSQPDTSVINATSCASAVSMTSQIPIPSELSSVCADITAWAVRQPLIVKTFGFGSRFKGSHRPDSDLDIAVALAGADENEIFQAFMDQKATWQEALSKVTKFQVHLQLAHPKIASVVWSYLENGNAIIFER